MDNIVLTAEEKKAIRALKSVAKTWPESLWLFSASGSLLVMRRNEDGCIDPEDPSLIVDEIKIPNDGGDF